MHNDYAARAVGDIDHAFHIIIVNDMSADQIAEDLRALIAGPSVDQSIYNVQHPTV
jgi:hypothetical protein